MPRTIRLTLNSLALGLACAAGLALCLPEGALAAPASSPPAEGIQRQEIESLIRRIENPKEREALVRQLRLLLGAQRGEAPPAPPKEDTSSFDHFFAETVQRLNQTVRETLASFEMVPEKLARIPERWEEAFSRHGGLQAGLRFLVALAAALAFLAAARFLLRRLLPKPSGDGTGHGWFFRVLAALREWLERVLPAGALLAGGSLLVVLLGLGRTEEGLLLIFLWAVFLQLFLQGAVAAFLAPERPGWRPVPVEDETAVYFSLWSNRFILVGVWGEALAQVCRALDLGPELPLLVSHAYRFILLLQILVMVFQQRDRARAFLSLREPENAPGPVRVAVHAWNIAAARWHLIAVPYFVIFYLFWTGGSRARLRLLIEATVLTVVIAAAALALSRLAQLGTRRLFAVNERLRRLVPGIEYRVNLYTPVITTALVVLVWAGAALLILDAWGVPTLALLFSRAGLALLGSLLGIALTTAVAALLIEAARAALEYFLTGRRRADGTPRIPTPQQRTLLPLAFSVFKWAVIVGASISIMANVGVNVAPILAGAGIIGLAVGFGAQSLVKDVITGVFMLLENNIAVGDVVKVKDIGGFVEGFNLRSVRLRDYDGNVHVIPNGSIDVVTNFTKEFSQAVFEIGVAYRENVDEVIEVIREVAEGMRADPEWSSMILEPVEIAGLDKFADSAVVIKGRFKTRPIKQWSVRREFYRRIKNTFDARGIEIPFPYRTLAWAQPKGGEGGSGDGQKAAGAPFPAATGKGERPQEGRKEGA
ncbi:MAG: mechanosensitive ion channel [Candidatus Tectomicrobia bacterium]|uniref:Mechanosensitive ion channel n=1 Tax=Tectimicrobiota bacterium TaxID=2528274 RepID=A0A932I2Q9_UNCTE|nr:mechanosensitive ion channel [Candidatus Tectomicrobia bacterium]